MTIAVVTGANRGIGLEVCRQLASRGMTVVLTARDLGKATDAAMDLEGDVRPYRLDVSSPSLIARFAAELETDFDAIDVLVNNAAINYDTGNRAISVPLSFIRETMETNVYGAWGLTQALLPVMRKSPHPRVVNVSSEGGSLASMGGGTPAYSMSKAALNAVTLMLAGELRGSGFLVNSVCPGWVATDMGGPGGRPVSAGASSVVWAATLPDNGPTGGFFRDGKPVPW